MTKFLATQKSRMALAMVVMLIALLVPGTLIAGVIYPLVVGASLVALWIIAIITFAVLDWIDEGEK